jgi:hypothetical protein
MKTLTFVMLIVLLFGCGNRVRIEEGQTVILDGIVMSLEHIPANADELAPNYVNPGYGVGVGGGWHITENNKPEQYLVTIKTDVQTVRFNDSTLYRKLEGKKGQLVGFVGKELYRVTYDNNGKELYREFKELKFVDVQTEKL